MISQQEHDEAIARGEEKINTQPRAIKASFDVSRNLIVLELNKGYSLAFSPQRSQVLTSASPAQLSQIEIDFPGFSIYFPLLDEGLQLSSILSGRFGNDRWEAAWAAAHPSEQAA